MDADLLITSSNAKRPDQWLAAMYSACDLTCLPTAGEGFGYPVVESLACGTPCVTGAFGAQSEFLTGWRDAWVCPTIATHLITNNTLIEPIYDPQQFASRLLMAWTEIRQRGTLLREECRQRAQQWDWSVIWPHWERWFLHGAAEMQAAKEKSDATPGNVNVNRPDESIDAPTPNHSASVGSSMGTDVEPAGQHPSPDPAGGLDSGTPLRLVGETDAEGA
jgi:hypothetical protein